MKKNLRATLIITIAFTGVLSAWNLPFPDTKGLNLNNNNISLKNQFIFSMSTFGGSTLYQNSFLQSLTWKLQGPWSMTLDYSLNSFSPSFNAGSIFDKNNIMPLGSVRVDYNDGKKTAFFVRYGSLQPENPGFFRTDFWNNGPSAWNDPSLLKQNFLQVYYHTTVFNGLLDLSVYYANPIHTP